MPSSSLDQLFLQRIEDIIAKEKWLAQDPVRSLQRRPHAGSSAGSRCSAAAAAAASSAGASTGPAELLPLPLATLPTSSAITVKAGKPGGGFSPKLLLLCLVVLILILVILIVYML